MLGFIRAIFRELGYFWDRIFGYAFDYPEFWFGTLIGLLAAILGARLSPISDMIREWLQGQVQDVNLRRSSASMDRYRVELTQHAVLQHLARALFSLDEIIVEPRLLAPPLPADPQREDPLPEDTLSVLPNLPDQNYLSGVYRSPTISLGDALTSEVDLLITGRCGAGKSTALAYLAMRAAVRDPVVGPAADLTPVLVHASDLVLDRATEKDPLKAVIAAAQQPLPSGASSRFNHYLRSQFGRKRALLLLDGLDEFAPSELPSIASWLARLRSQHAGNRIVATGAVRQYDGLVDAGLTPIPIAPWSQVELRNFLQRWASAWRKEIVPLLPKRRMADVDPDLLNGWLIGSLRGFSPLEITLMTWAAYVGDARGPRAVDALEAFVARFLSPGERKSAQRSALAWINSRSGVLTDRQLQRGTPIASMEEAGIMTRHVGNRVRFSQPNIGAYLAACALAEGAGEDNFRAVGWAPAEETTRYYAAMDDISSISDGLLAVTDDPTETNLICLGEWIRDAPKKMLWRGQVLRSLATIANAAKKPYGLRLRSAHLLAESQEDSVAILFRRLLKSDVPSNRVLGALGLGGLRDEESVDLLIKTIQEKHNRHARGAACLALAAIGTDAALEGLGRLLLEGEENVRIAAAEALACHPDEGYPMLREAIGMENLLTRRAAVFGLARIPEPWALDALEKAQVDDEQWVVRGAAAEAVERRKNPPWRVERPPDEPAEMPWLIAYAEREGLGVAPGPAAMEMIRRALNKGTADEKIAALEAIAWLGGEDLSMELTHALHSSEPVIRDAAFEALWQMRARGIMVRAPLGAPAST